MKKILMLLVGFMAGCAGIPGNVKPVDGFSMDRYLGTWFEIARLDHSFERGLTRVVAQYSLRADGGVKVVNSGFRAKDRLWIKAEGKAYFAGATDQGYLKVSFFGPFYGSYVIFELDHQDYQYALVCGPDKSYLWILARTPDIAPGLRDRLVSKAAAAGFDTTKLIFAK